MAARKYPYKADIQMRFVLCKVSANIVRIISKRNPPDKNNDLHDILNLSVNVGNVNLDARSVPAKTDIHKATSLFDRPAVSCNK